MRAVRGEADAASQVLNRDWRGLNRPPEVLSVIHLLQGLRQRLMQSEVALREAQAQITDAEAASCAAMAERLQSGACDTHSHH